MSISCIHLIYLIYLRINLLSSVFFSSYIALHCMALYCTTLYCSGSTAVRYGSMRENVLNVTAVLSDGTIVKTGSRAR